MNLPSSNTCATSFSQGVIASLSQPQYAFLLELQTRLNTVVKGVGGISHEAWRTFRTERREKPSWHYIDGDLIEQFLDLPLALKQKVYRELGDTFVQFLIFFCFFAGWDS